MADLEAKVSSILEELINAAVSEMSNNPDGWNSSGASPRVSENTNEKVHERARAAPEPLLLPLMRRSHLNIELEQLALVSIQC